MLLHSLFTLLHYNYLLSLYCTKEKKKTKIRNNKRPLFTLPENRTLTLQPHRPLTLQTIIFSHKKPQKTLKSTQANIHLLRQNPKRRPHLQSSSTITAAIIIIWPTFKALSLPQKLSQTIAQTPRNPFRRTLTDKPIFETLKTTIPASAQPHLKPHFRSDLSQQTTTVLFRLQTNPTIIIFTPPIRC